MKEQIKVKGVSLYGEAWPWYLAFFLTWTRLTSLSDILFSLHICRLSLLCI